MSGGLEMSKRYIREDLERVTKHTLHIVRPVHLFYTGRTISKVKNITEIRPINYDKPVFVYRNLHKKCWSIKQGGLVVGYSIHLTLKDAKCIVNKKGNEKVRITNQKNVHAFIKGYICDNFEFNGESISYNPYTDDTFIMNNTPVHNVCYVLFNNKVVGINQTNILAQLREQDQAERKEYSDFVLTKYNGDYKMAVKEYYKLKNRDSFDIFDDNPRMKIFMSIDFDFVNFTKNDWENYWLLSQHADLHIKFQIFALEKITKYLGVDNEYYKYLSDRISCSQNGTQKYGTQCICEKCN